MAGEIWEDFLREVVLEADIEESGGLQGGAAPKVICTLPRLSGTDVAGPKATRWPSHT